MDKRSLGLLRIALGLVLLLDVLLRWLHYRSHYTLDGIFPLKDYLVQPDIYQRRWSVFYLNDTPTFVFLMFALFFVAALALTLGFRTRWAGWLCLLMILGVYRRNPVLNNSGDIYLPLILMWGNFLPWAEAFSIDADPRLTEQETTYSALPGFFYLIQVAMVYWFSAVLRVGQEWQVDHSALYYALHLDPINTALAPYLLLLGSDVLALITWATLFLEAVGPLLLLVPNQLCRLLSVLLIVSFHLGIMATLLIPVFALTCIVAPLGLLPPLIWKNRLGRKLEQRLYQFFLALRSRLPGRLPPFGPTVPTTISRRTKAIYPWLTVPLMGMTIFHLWWGIHWPDDRLFLSGTLKVLSLDQRWGMFSPRPPDFIGWESAWARTESGREVNLITGGTYSDSDSDLRNSVSLTDYRWRSFHLTLTTPRRSHAQLYLRYLAKEWNQEHPADPVVTAKYIYHPRTIPSRYMLGEDGRDVLAVYP